MCFYAVCMHCARLHIICHNGNMEVGPDSTKVPRFDPIVYGIIVINKWGIFKE